MGWLAACTAVALGPGPCWTGLSGGGPDRGWQLAPTADVGWPVIRAGVQGAARRRFGSERGGLALTAQAALHGGARDLGVPGARLQAIGQIGVKASLGPVDVGYQPLVYVDTVGTSQTSAAITIGIRGRRADFTFRFENDYLTPRSRDEFRTAAVEAWLVTPRGLGAGVQLQLWTASTPDERLDYPEPYDLRGRPGFGYSHGLACAAVAVGPVQVCVGVDAEAVRDVLQNRFVHRIIDDGVVPVLDRPVQPAVRVSVNRGRAVY